MQEAYPHRSSRVLLSRRAGVSLLANRRCRCPRVLAKEGREHGFGGRPSHSGRPFLVCGTAVRQPRTACVWLSLRRPGYAPSPRATGSPSRPSSRRCCSRPARCPTGATGARDQVGRLPCTASLRPSLGLAADSQRPRVLRRLPRVGGYRRGARQTSGDGRRRAGVPEAGSPAGLRPASPPSHRRCQEPAAGDAAGVRRPASRRLLDAGAALPGTPTRPRSRTSPRSIRPP